MVPSLDIGGRREERGEDCKVHAKKEDQTWKEEQEAWANNEEFTEPTDQQSGAMGVARCKPVLG